MNDMVNYGHILLVEDDTRLAELISQYLCQYGFKVTIEANGNQVSEVVLELDPDLVILDIMLPGRDGFDVCRQIRNHYRKPVVFLTARSDQMDEILGLEIGADDYLTKPIEPRLLISRVRALLRRDQQFSRDIQTNGNQVSRPEGHLVLDRGNRKITYNSEMIHLTQPEYELLELLLEEPGKIFSRDELYRTLKGIEYDGVNRYMDILISSVRAKIPEPDAIITIRNKGYLLKESLTH